MPPEPTTTAQKKEIRRVLLRMLLDLRVLVASRKSSTEEIMVQFAVRLGQYEGRPVDATEIALITTIPRTSVLRHLKVLEERGHTSAKRAGRRVVRYIPPESENGDISAFYRDVEKVVRRTCRELSKMDTSLARHGK